MQVLDFSALEHNALFFKKLLGDSKMCAVVKNNAYGHGLVHVARYLDGIVDCFAVGSIEEAKQIDFVSKDILILLPQNTDNTVAAARGEYILSVDSFETLHTVSVVANKLQLPIRAHIKIDSGMSRLGFRQYDIKKLLTRLQSCRQIVVEGVYSHFYGENIIQCDKQYDVFLLCAAQLESGLNKHLTKHIANSNGALISSKYRLDMARICLGLYGYGNDNLMPVKTVTAQVVAVKNVSEGDVVGYGAKYVVPNCGRVAVLDVGYAYGFNRALVGSPIQINGRNCRVVAVCMAMIMADVSDVDVKVGDNATLLGNGVNVANDVVSVYELLCNLK